MRKPTVRADIGVVGNAHDFLSRFWPRAEVPNLCDEWMRHCQRMKADYQPIIRVPQTGINSYAFVDELARHLDPDAIIVTDVGFCFIPAMQTMKLRQGQRLIHSAGVSPMGWGLPAAIGASFASARQTVCLTGDGGLMMNLQELQTIVHHQLPVAIFVFENDGYATMRIAQNTHFKREVMSSPRSGMSLPDFGAVANAFGIFKVDWYSQQSIAEALPEIFKFAAQGSGDGRDAHGAGRAYRTARPGACRWARQVHADRHRGYVAVPAAR